METKSKVGHIAALVAAVFYVLSVIHLTIGTIVEMSDDNPHTDDDTTGGVMFLIWGILVFVGTIAAVVALYSLLKRSGLHSKGLGLAAVVVGVLAIVVSFFCWLWPIWGILLGVAILLAALALRPAGVIGVASAWDWAPLAAWVVGTLVTYILYWTDTVEATDDLEWAYTGGFAIGALVTAATLVQISRWLRTPAPMTGVVAPPV